MPRIVVMISGNGSNLQALIDNQQEKGYKIVLVVSNKAEAYGLQRAEKAGIERMVLPSKGRKREEFDKELAQKIKEKVVKIDLVVLAGWMRVLTSEFLKEFEERVVNLHPSLPGQFEGVNAIGRAYEAYQKGEVTETGVMVHIVTEEVDRGRLIEIGKIDFKQGESIEEFEQRVHETEWRVIVDGVCKELNRRGFL